LFCLIIVKEKERGIVTWFEEVQKWVCITAGGTEDLSPVDTAQGRALF
jgi:hypothetical protein